jgi:acylphosphatase
MEEFHAIVSGRVQMVMFRDFTQRHARRFGIVGTVHNLPDGMVEVVAQGSREALEYLIRDLHKGSLLSKVKEVRVEWRAPQKRFDSFEIVY